MESDISPQQLQPVSAKLEIRVFDKSESRRSEAGQPPPVPTIAVVTPAAPAPAIGPVTVPATAAPVSAASSAAGPLNSQVRRPTGLSKEQRMALMKLMIFQVFEVPGCTFFFVLCYRWVF